MSDTTSSTPTTPATPKKKRKQSPAGIRKKDLQELTKAEQVVAAAKKPAHVTKLNAREIPATKVTTLEGAITGVRNKIADAVQSATNRKAETANEAVKMRALIVMLQQVQAAAKQKYLTTDPIRLQDYFVGQHLNGNRSNLEQTSAAILEKLNDDTLPGITDGVIDDLTAAREAWMASNVSQADDDSAAQTDLLARDAMMDDIVNKRLEIQFAADAEWPYSDRDNEAVRRLFQLPVNRPLSVPVS